MNEKREWVTTRRFDVLSASGRRYTVTEQQQMTTMTYLDGKRETTGGVFRLSAGINQPVNREPDGRMTLAATGETLTPV